jgi:hypothetical protein
MKKFSAYIALGDSMSIDLYPALDLDQPENTPIGASALLHKNQAKFWPRFDGRDLSTTCPGIDFINLTEDGATTWDLLDGDYFGHVEKYFEKTVLITVTLGGNDALRLLSIDSDQPTKLTSEAANIVDRYRKVLNELCSKFSDATVILNSIYDPSDGGGVMPHYPGFADKLPFLRYVNEQIELYARENNHLFANTHDYFLGHGVTAAADQCWYWQGNPIEPSALGASELRALWLRTLEP